MTDRVFDSPDELMVEIYRAFYTALESRQRQVIIEKLDFEKILKRYDTLNTFFYLDLSYFTKEYLYNREYAEALTKHEEMAQLLKTFKSKFLLYYNGDPNIRNINNDFIIEAVEALYAVTGSFQTETELLIRYY